jgi:hypothetical protein
MTSHPVDRPVSPLRARMIEDMTVRGFNEQHVCIMLAMCGRSRLSSAAHPTRQQKRMCAASSCTSDRAGCCRRA